MLTLEMLKELPAGEIFAKGEAVDSPLGIHMMNSGRQLRWVAVRGGMHDWTIYCHHAENPWYFIKAQGDKVCNESTIKRLIPCDGPAWNMYRL